MTVVVKLLREAAPMTMKFVRSECAHTVGKLSRCFILVLDAYLLTSKLVCVCKHVSAPAERLRDMDQVAFVDSTVSQKPGRVGWVVRCTRCMSGCSGRSGVDASPVT